MQTAEGFFFPSQYIVLENTMSDEKTTPETEDAAPAALVDMPEPVVEDVRIPAEEWMAISRDLECHHAVFYKFWDMGKPIFSDAVETAAVQFDETGDFVIFHFNPIFWKKLDHYNKMFVICHEALHVILNHGVRIKDAGINRQATNAALDVVVNHSLVRDFGFDRDSILNEGDLCWTDTVFKGRDPLPPDNEMFEFYYNLFEKCYGPGGGPGEGGEGRGDNSMGGHSDGEGTVDDHSFMKPGEGEEESGDWDKVVDKLNEGISEEEKEGIKNLVDKHFQQDGKPSSKKNQKAGTGTGGIWTFAGKKKVKKKKKWETVIKKWSRKYLKDERKEVEQWARINRRMSMLPTNMFLPSEMEIDDTYEDPHKIKVYFFLDTSGSCWGLKDRFFDAALSLPTDRFDVRLFCFDTTVKETTLESRKVYGGGGTAFNIIEAHVQKEMRKEEKGKYPEAVFVITDGYGNHVKPEAPQKWYWFLTQGGSKSYIPKESNTFNLGDYE